MDLSKHIGKKCTLRIENGRGYIEVIGTLAAESDWKATRSLNVYPTEFKVVPVDEDRKIASYLSDIAKLRQENADLRTILDLRGKPIPKVEEVPQERQPPQGGSGVPQGIIHDLNRISKLEAQLVTLEARVADLDSRLRSAEGSSYGQRTS